MDLILINNTHVDCLIGQGISHIRRERYVYLCAYSVFLILYTSSLTPVTNYMLLVMIECPLTNNKSCGRVFCIYHNNKYTVYLLKYIYGIIRYGILPMISSILTFTILKVFYCCLHCINNNNRIISFSLLYAFLAASLSQQYFTQPKLHLGCKKVVARNSG